MAFSLDLVHSPYNNAARRIIIIIIIIIIIQISADSCPRISARVMGTPTNDAHSNNWSCIVARKWPAGLLLCSL